MTKLLPAILMALAVLNFSACSGEDRSGEQPFAPQVVLRSATATDCQISFIGEVLSSTNSTLTDCGFYYGDSTMQQQVTCEEPAFTFSGKSDTLSAGRYYVVAFATNKIGKSTSDTLWCEVN